MATSARFWDKIARRYARQPVADAAAYRKKLEVTQQYLRPDMDVFEFGCGTGSTALEHAPFVRHIEATDISAEMIEIAREKAMAAGVENVRFTQAGIEEFDAPDAAFDAVLAMSILHLVEDRTAVIAKAYKLLKPGGVFVSSTTCIADMASILRLILPVGYALGFFPRVHVFSAENLKAAFVHEGFEIDYDWRPGPGKAVFAIARKPT